MTWLRPKDLTQALTWLDQYNPQIVCGGTDLFVNSQRNQVELQSKDWLDIGTLAELKQIRITDEGLEIGAAVTAAELWQHPLGSQIPALVQAARIVGGWQVQNRASLGGNVANASPAADMIIPLSAYQADIRLSNLDRTREISIDEFILGPRKTKLQQGEMITSILIPNRVLAVPQMFLRHDQRGATDISIISVAIVLKASTDSFGWGANLTWGKAAIGAANPIPLIQPELDAVWSGELTAAKVESLAKQYALKCNPISDVRASSEYRQAMVKVFIVRAVEQLIEEHTKKIS